MNNLYSISLSLYNLISPYCIDPGIYRDKTMADKFIYILIMLNKITPLVEISGRNVLTFYFINQPKFNTVPKVV